MPVTTMRPSQASRVRQALAKRPSIRVARARTASDAVSRTVRPNSISRCSSNDCVISCLGIAELFELGGDLGAIELVTADGNFPARNDDFHCRDTGQGAKPLFDVGDATAALDVLYLEYFGLHFASD